jgi:thioredoxin 1
MSEQIQAVTDDNFENTVLQANGPVLIDFWAEWCGPCKMLAPLLEEVAGEYGDKIKIVKMNVDANEQVPAKYGIRGIPTLIIFKNGEAADTKVGALSKEQLTEFIDSQV